MQITTGQQLLQHVNTGGLIKLDDGQIKSQSSIGRAFQNFGDVFLKLSERGRAHIEKRQNDLKAAVSDMLRSDSSFNPVGNNGEVPPLNAGRMQRLNTDISITRAFNENKFPEESRATASNLVKALMAHKGFPGDHSQAEIQETASGYIRTLQSKKGLMDVLGFSSNLNLRDNPDKVRSFADAVTSDAVHTVEDQLGTRAQTFIQPNGLHNAYGIDASRNMVENIDGRKPLNGNFPNVTHDVLISQLEQDFIDHIPDQYKSYIPVISMFCSQAGLTGSVTTCEESPEGLHLSDKHQIAPEAAAHGFSIRYTGQKVSLTFDKANNKAIFDCHFDRNLNGMKALGLPRDLTLLATNRYHMQFELDMSQPWTPGMTPALTCTDMGITPVDIEI